MIISIVMTSYNGEEYIIEQLDSIRNQTRKPDEVLVFDDGSTDKTVQIVSDYIEQHQLAGWKIERNEANLGWRQNFMQGFQQARGDIIFSADQDDIWDLHKLDKMSSVLETNPEIDILACNIDPFCEEIGQDKGLTAHHLDNYGANLIERVIFDKLWLEPRRQGCTMCFRNTILPSILSVWFKECAHDLAIWSYGVATGSLCIYNEKLVRYRRHAGVNTPSNMKTAVVRSGLLKVYYTLSDNYLSQSKDLCLSDSRKIEIERLSKFYKKRYKAITTRNIFTLISLLGDMRLYTKPAAWAADVISAFR